MFAILFADFRDIHREAKLKFGYNNVDNIFLEGVYFLKPKLITE